MSLYDIILKELDLNEGDEFVTNDCKGRVLRFKDREIQVKIPRISWMTMDMELNYLLNLDNGITITKRASWIPKSCEWYYTPDLSNVLLFSKYKNTGDPFDDRIIELNLAFKTETEAIACAKKMLEAIK